MLHIVGCQKYGIALTIISAGRVDYRLAVAMGISGVSQRYSYADQPNLIACVSVHAAAGMMAPGAYPRMRCQALPCLYGGRCKPGMGLSAY